MHYLSDKYVSYLWLKQITAQAPQAYSLINIPETSNRFRINTQYNSEQWPNLVIKPSGKMKGQSVFMLKADSEEKAMAALQITHPDQMPPMLTPRGIDRLVDPLFGSRKTVIYQDFVPPTVKEGKAGRIRLNVFANPLKSFSLSDYYMWTVFDVPEQCPDGLLKNANPYVVNWASSGKKTRFAELTSAERELTDPAVPQVCGLIQAGLERKFIHE